MLPGVELYPEVDAQRVFFRMVDDSGKLAVFMIDLERLK